MKIKKKNCNNQLNNTHQSQTRKEIDNRWFKQKKTTNERAK